VSVASSAHGISNARADIRAQLEQRVAGGELVRVEVQGLEAVPHWARPEELAVDLEDEPAPTHILSPFDPLIIQRARLHAFFEYEHRFEAYLPKEKRLFGYFTLPVLVGGQIVALLDLKTERDQRRLAINKWTWLGKHESARRRRAIEEALHRFEQFQLGSARSA
jgi:hypothetical protein